MKSRTLKASLAALVCITAFSSFAKAGDEEAKVIVSCGAKSDDAASFAGCVLADLTVNELTKLGTDQFYGCNNDIRKLLYSIGVGSKCSEKSQPPVPPAVSLTIVRVTQICSGYLAVWSNKSVYLSPNGLNLGGGGNTELVYDGTSLTSQRILALVPYQCGVIQAFDGGGIYYSPNGKGLGSNLVYNGGQKVLFMVPFRGGILTRFDGKGIYFSKTEKSLGGGDGSELVYNGNQRLLRMVVVGGNVYSKFDGGGCYLSPDGRNLGGSGLTLLLAKCPDWLS